MINPYLILLIVSVAIASFAQILLKKASMRTYDSPIKEYLNLYVICGYGLMFLSLFMTMISYKGFKNFANVPLIESLGYAMVMVLGYFFFKEKITVRKVLGIALILAGIFVYNMI
ncbi:MAG: EamA family transporter [Lachnospiraceae bacterium]|nr:EamA family transporter [Lachnospiraceae bacterium]